MPVDWVDRVDWEDAIRMGVDDDPDSAYQTIASPLEGTGGHIPIFVPSPRHRPLPGGETGRGPATLQGPALAHPLRGWDGTVRGLRAVCHCLSIAGHLRPGRGEYP